MQALTQQKTLSSLLSLFTQILIFVFLCSVESIFFSPRSSFIEIDLWIVSVIFICLHRTLVTSFFFCVLSAFFFSAFSGIPLYAGLLSLFSVFALLHIIKNRSFTGGASYFSICAFVSILTFYTSYFAFSWIFGENPITNPSVIKWITSALMSSALFVLIRPLLIFADSLFAVKYPFGFEV
jgi:hypothetical protein